MAAWNEAEASDILRRHEGRKGPLLPILHDVQAAFGYVPVEAVPFIAACLERQPSRGAWRGFLLSRLPARTGRPATC